MDRRRQLHCASRTSTIYTCSLIRHYFRHCPKCMQIFPNFSDNISLATSGQTFSIGLPYTIIRSPPVSVFMHLSVVKSYYRHQIDQKLSIYMHTSKLSYRRETILTSWGLSIFRNFSWGVWRAISFKQTRAHYNRPTLHTAGLYTYII